jgi:hypothetical protein
MAGLLKICFLYVLFCWVLARNSRKGAALADDQDRLRARGHVTRLVRRKSIE